MNGFTTSQTSVSLSRQAGAVVAFTQGGSEFSTNKSKAKDGVSLGRYASAAGLTIITLEVQGNDRAVSGKAGNDRAREVLAYNEAIKALFLGMTP